MILSAQEKQTLPLSEIVARITQDPVLMASGNKDLTLKNLPDGSVSLEPKSFLGGGHRQEAADLLRAAALREVGADHVQGGMIMMQQRQLDKAQKFTLNEVQSLYDGVGEVKQLVKAQQEAIFNHGVSQAQADYANLRNNAPPPQAANLPSPPVDAMLQDANSKVIISSSGANCPLIIKSDMDPSGGTLIKAEAKDAVDIANIQSRMMADLSEKTGGMGFQVAKAVEYIPTNDEKTAIKATIDGLKNNQGLSAAQRERVETFETRINNLQTVEERESGLQVGGEANSKGIEMSVTKMDYVNGTQLNQLPLEQKVALLKSPEFAQQMGRMAALGPMMGLTDHMCVSNAEGYMNSGSNGTNNPSNFMLSKVDGSVIPIDYNSHTRSQNGEPLAIGTQHPDIAVMNLAKFVNSGSPQDAANQVMANLGSLEYTTPISNAMTTMLHPEKDARFSADCFFSHTECHVLENPNIISEADKRAFIQNFMEGAKNGLDFIEQKIPAFEAAYAESAKQSGLDPNGQRHFMKADQLDNISVGLNAMKVDVNQGYTAFEAKKNLQMQAEAKIEQAKFEQAKALAAQQAAEQKVEGPKVRSGSVLDDMNNDKAPKKRMPKAEQPDLSPEVGGDKKNVAKTPSTGDLFKSSSSTNLNSSDGVKVKR